MRLALIVLLALAACGRGSEQKAAAPSAPAAAPMSGAIIAGGDGWRLVADPASQAIVMTMNNGDVYSAAYAPPQHTATGYRIAAGDVTLELETTPCAEDGVSYPMRATAQARAHEAVTGCAAVRWDAYLLQVMPQIDACVAASPGTRYVTYAGDDGAGAVIVRMRGVDGQFDCSFVDGVAQVGPREAAVRVPGENDAIFVRANFDGGGDNPGGECYAAPEVRRDGELLGWMDDPEGC